MNELLSRKMWIIRENESRADYVTRLNLQHRQLIEFKRAKGQCYMVLFGEDDARPMWENQISIKELKEQIRNPHGNRWDCPLCQPYDNWEGIAGIEQNRRYMTRIIYPRYNNGAIEEEGIYQKCPCILRPKQRTHLKFKE